LVPWQSDCLAHADNPTLSHAQVGVYLLDPETTANGQFARSPLNRNKPNG
jgi:hypothetical protein